MLRSRYLLVVKETVYFVKVTFLWWSQHPMWADQWLVDAVQQCCLTTGPYVGE